MALKTKLVQSLMLCLLEVICLGFVFSFRRKDSKADVNRSNFVKLTRNIMNPTRPIKLKRTFHCQIWLSPRDVLGAPSVSSKKSKPLSTTVAEKWFQGCVCAGLNITRTDYSPSTSCLYICSLIRLSPTSYA